MKITSEIYQVGGSGISDGEDAAVYLVRFGEHAAVIDAGCGYSTETIIKNIYSCGVKPDRIFLSEHERLWGLICSTTNYHIRQWHICNHQSYSIQNRTGIK